MLLQASIRISEVCAATSVGHTKIVAKYFLICIFLVDARSLIAMVILVNHSCWIAQRRRLRNLELVQMREKAGEASYVVYGIPTVARRGHITMGFMLSRVNPN